jgi:hypothetical protein
MTVTKGKVIFPAGREFPSMYSSTSRQNVKVLLQTGEEVTIWENVGHPFTRLQKDDLIDVIQTAKGYSVSESSIPNAAPQIGFKQSAQSGNVAPIFAQMAHQNAAAARADAPEVDRLSKIPPPQTMHEIKTYTEYLSRHYHFIYKTVCAEMETENLKDELLKDISTSIFIQTNKKFMI